jgi:hypothetical protein
MKKKIILFILVITSAIFNIQAQKNHLLAFKFVKGTKYKTQISSIQKVQIMGQDLPQTMIFEADFDVLDVDSKGNGKVKMTYTRVKFEQENPMLGKLAFDSNEPENTDDNSQMFKQMFGQIVGKEISFQMKSNGEILEVLDGDATLKEAFKKDSNFPTFPTKTLKIGDSWKSTQEKNISGAETIIETTNTLKEVKDGKYIIEITGKVKSKE